MRKLQRKRISVLYMPRAIYLIRPSFFLNAQVVELVDTHV